MRGYDEWKLASPDDYYRTRERAGQCPQCNAMIYVGQTAYYEGVCGEYFCDSDCYRTFVRDNINDYLDVIEEAYQVREKTVEE